MAINENPNEIEGVNLPYIKIDSYFGSKSTLSVVVGCSSSKDHNPLVKKSIPISDSDILILSDNITSMLYDKLKEMGYLSGIDI